MTDKTETIIETVQKHDNIATRACFIAPACIFVRHVHASDFERCRYGVVKEHHIDVGLKKNGM